MAAQQSDHDVSDRIASLERRLASLEARFDAGQGRSEGVGSSSMTSPVGERWRVIANWRSGLRLGASESEVRSALGEPDAISGGVTATWRYGRPGSVAMVLFYQGKVHSWTEPS